MIDNSVASSSTSSSATQVAQNTQLQAGPPSVIPAKAPVDPVDQAAKTVHDKLDQSGWFNDVTHDELKDINSTMHNLTPQQRNEVLGKISDPDLKTWADESGSWGAFGTGGLDRTEKQSLFNDLAQGADGAQLERLSHAFNSEDDAKLLGDSIASQATPQSQLAFVQRMSGQVETNPQVALQVAKAIGGMAGSPAEVDQALQALDGGKLQAVVDAAKQENYSTSMMGGGGVLSYDVGPLAKMIDAAATGTDVAQKARLFEASSKALGDIAKIGYFSIPGTGILKNNAESQLTQSLSKLITSDTNGVMRELESQFRQGKGLSTFTKQMIDQGRTDELKVIMSQLQRGNDLTGDALTRFSQPDAQGQYRDAQTLGYFVGSIYSATQSMRGDVDKQVSTFKAIFGGGLSGGKDIASNLWLSAGAAKAVLGAGVGAVASVTLLTADEIGRQLKAGIIDQRDALSQLAYPREANGRLYEGERAETAYDTAVGRVIDANN